MHLTVAGDFQVNPTSFSPELIFDHDSEYELKDETKYVV